MTFVPRSWAIDQLYELAEAQLGHFAASQAADVGIDRRYLAHHARSGNLQRVEHGIYRLRNFPSQRFEDVMVAVLWTGGDAVASHETALAIYELADAMPAVTHLTIERRFRGVRRGVIVHHAPLPATDVTARDDIPVTTPMRTLHDCAADPSVLVTAAAEALDRGLVRAYQLEEFAGQRPDLAASLAEALS